MIQTEHLGKLFGNYWAVNEVNLIVQPGQILALLGQNGAGKTTTVRLLTAVLRPSSGWAKVAGYDVVTQADKVRELVGVLTEQHGLYSRMSAVEYLDFFGRVYRLSYSERKKRSDYLLDYFGLSYVAKQRLGEYSKGMRQKLALARSMLHNPLVLLLDEPTSAMDPESALLVRSEIANLRSSNRTIIICTHNLTEAESLADRIAIIYRGKILIEGTIPEIKKELLGVPEYDIAINGNVSLEDFAFPEGIKISQINSAGFRISVEEPRVSNPELVNRLVSKNVPIVSIQEVPRSLEHVYLKVMEKVARIKLPEDVTHE